ncbi:MAG TPA: hypothetical protein VFV50_12280 [Bdellovibrionales bacterium]|nr:hypothetical protein [Bdellovibrionales bacterium]
MNARAITVVLSLVLLSPVSAPWARAESRDQGADELLVVVQKRGPRGLEQTSLAFTSARVVLLTNSDFLTRPAARANARRKVLLGKFTSAANKPLSGLREDFEQIAARLPRLPAAAAPASSSHELELQIDGRTVSPRSPFFNVAVELVGEALRSQRWTPEDAAIVTIENGKATIAKASSRSVPAAPKCEVYGRRRACTAAPFGFFSY